MNATDRDDSGVSLIELIIYVLLASVILIATSMILINSWNTQKNVTSVSEATNRGQSMGSTIERAMRNALAFEVTNENELRVRTSLTGSQQCQAFYLAPGTARLAQAPGALPLTPASWTLWNSGVKQNGLTPFFAQVIDQPSAFETLATVSGGGAVEVRSSDRAPDADTAGRQ